MKKITLLLILLTVSFGYSQQVLIEDFENSPALDSWDGAVVAIGNDPVGSNGQNMQVDVTAGVGQFWQGAKVTLPADVAMDLTTDLTVLVDIYSTTAMTIMGKVEGDGPPSADDEDHGGTGWETITFTFNTGADNTVTANGEYNLFAVFPNRDGAGGWTDPWASSTTYYDNITAVLAVVNPDPEPTVAAPTPMQDPADVISIFSGAYTDLAGTDFNPNWGQTTAVSFLDIVGNETMKYDNFNYQGTQLVANQDLSEMEFMHIDVWTPDATIVKTTPISATTGEFLVDLTPINQGSWNSYDIPVSDFTGVSMADIHQLKFDGQAGVNPSTLFIDNIYFWKNSTIPTEPTVAAPIPTQDPADVISIFSGTYTDLAGTDFNPNWGQTTAVSFLDIVGNETMKYDNFNYQGTQLVANQDLSEMEFMHIDVWTPDATIVKTTPISATTGEFLVDLTPINQGSWNSYDIPISDFTGVSMADIHQLKFDGQAGVNPSTLFIDNIYFWKSPTAVPEPTVAAPIPNHDPTNVISMFSDAYTDVPVDTWLTPWSDGQLDDVLIAGNPTKKYSAMNFIGVETIGPNLIDATEMTYFHIDVWTPDANDFKIKLVDFGADGAFGGGDDTEHELVFPAPVTGSWISYDIPLSDFVGLLNTDHLAQLIMVKAPLGTIFVDNVFYYTDPIAQPEPTVAAPIPNHDPANVISMFSDAYTDVPVDTWLTPWSQGSLEDVLIAGNPTKKYTDVNFVGVETVGPNLIDASSMTHIHIDFWSPDANDFKIKLVDFGADAAWGGGDDTEHELIFATPATETWISYNIPLLFFTDLVNTDHIAQLIISKGPLGTIYIDNVYYNTNTTAPLEPTVAAPTPTQDAANVISMFSDAYTDVPVDTWLTVWSEGNLEDVMISGNPTKKYTNVNFVGVETVGPNLIDASEMTIFHIDVWTPETNDFKIKLVDFGADATWGGGDDTEHELTFPAPTTGTWISYDIPLSDFTDLLNTDHLAQLIMVKAPLGTIFVDNVFFYNPTLSTSEFDIVDLNVYPNPTSNSWNFTSNYTIENIYVYDVLGKEVLAISPNASEATIDAISFNKGLYFTKVKTNMGVAEIKLIKK